MPATPGSPTGSLQWGGSVVDVVRGTTGRPWSSVSATCRVLLRASRIIQHHADVVVVRNSIRLWSLHSSCDGYGECPSSTNSRSRPPKFTQAGSGGAGRTPLVTRIIAKVGIHARSHVLGEPTPSWRSAMPCEIDSFERVGRCFPDCGRPLGAEG